MDLASFQGEPRHAWCRAYQELAGEAGALAMTLGNELRTGLEDFPAPWLERDRNRELLEHTLEARFMSCMATAWPFKSPF